MCVCVCACACACACACVCVCVCVQWWCVWSVVVSIRIGQEEEVWVVVGT